MKFFEKNNLKKLYQPEKNSSGEDNGQVTIIGGSRLFHGAPLLSLKVASRIVDMVFFATPEPSVGKVAEKIKSNLFSFIWIPWREADKYIKKSDAVLIGPGLMRYQSDEKKGSRKNLDSEGKKTREITRYFLKKFSDKRWVIDAGSLQVMDRAWIPPNSILTPNYQELKRLFGNKIYGVKANIRELTRAVEEKARKYRCIIVAKGPETIVSSPREWVIVKGGNPGLTKGGTGDVLAGLTVALAAKNDPFLAASAASYIIKTAADQLYQKVGVTYNADDLAEKIPETLHVLTSSA
jgi:NAD(P)H-hydrate epimerase